MASPSWPRWGPPLWPGLQDDVERRTGGHPHAREARLAQHLAHPPRAGLGAEPEGDLLRERRRRADHGRQAVVHPPDRVEVVRQPVTRRGLDQQQGAVGGQRLAGSGGPPRRGRPCRAGSRTSSPGRSRCPGTCEAVVTSNRVRPVDAGLARRRPGPPRSDGAWLSSPRKVDRSNARAMMTVEAPKPQPTSATLAPSRSFSTTPSRAGSQDCTRFAS